MIFFTPAVAHLCHSTEFRIEDSGFSIARLRRTVLDSTMEIIKGMKRKRRNRLRRERFLNKQIPEFYMNYEIPQTTYPSKKENNHTAAGHSES